MIQPLMTRRHSGNVSEELARVRANKKAAQAKCNLAAGQFFTFYANLLSKNAWYQWDKIVALQVDTAPWTDVRGKEQPTACVKSYLSFMDCVTLHLQTELKQQPASKRKHSQSQVVRQG